MSSFKLSQQGVDELKSSVKDALALAAEQFADDIREIAPRDTKTPRLPYDPSRPVTGNLKRSITYEVNDNLEAKIGVNLQHNLKEGKTPILEYARYQEFGTPKMRPRSYLRWGMVKFGVSTLKTFAYYLRRFLR